MEKFKQFYLKHKNLVNATLCFLLILTICLFIVLSVIHRGWIILGIVVVPAIMFVMGVCDDFDNEDKYDKDGR